MRTNRSEICRQFAEWLGEWPFTALLTLTRPYGSKGHGCVPPTFQGALERYLERFQKSQGVKVGAMGICTASYGGYLHSHVLTLREDGERFSESELAYLKRDWPHNADARQVVTLEPLLNYIASERHIVHCQECEVVFSGDEVLKQLRS